MDVNELPLLSVILPVFNEAVLLRRNIEGICSHLKTLENRYRWEVLVVNDGSSDGSADIIDALETEFPAVKALHHPTNFGVGQALRYGFANSKGDYVVTMDVDLSYDVHHVDEMVDVLRKGHAKVVLASPYMEGGSISNVPTLRKVLSVLGNRFLKFFSQGGLSTLTCMVRAFDGPFIRAMDLRSMGLELMPETLYKAMVLRARIMEIPGRLDWGPQLEHSAARTSSMRILKHINSTVMSGFAFRPMYFFIIPGMLLSLFSTYVMFWMVMHYLESLEELRSLSVDAGHLQALAVAYVEHQHTYVIGMLSVMLSTLLLGLGVLSAQNKRNFEELYHLSATKFHSLKTTIEHSQ